jgi:transcription antitermination factor NusA-like protein
MPYPVCELCTKTKYLCQDCKEKYENGSITAYDVTASKLLYFIHQDSIELVKAVVAEDYMILVVGKDDVGDVIGMGGTNLRKIETEFGKNVKVVGADSFTDLAKALIAPARVKSINEIMDADGRNGYRIRIPSADKNLLRMEPTHLKNIISAAAAGRVEIIFD